MESSSKFQGVRLIYTYRQRDVTRTEWVHESGVANVAILDNGEGLLFQPNRLLLSKPGIRHAEIPPVEQIHQELSSFCANKDTLGSFWSNNAKDGAINIK